MDVREFVKILGAEFYAGVPDSQLQPLCHYLTDYYGISHQHVIAANEGNAVGLAAGYHLATGKVPVVYMQNSGIGNVVNPVASLLNDKVYAIPCIFVIGWRGEPGVHDEPQHIFQGEVTNDLLEVMDIQHFILSQDTSVEDVKKTMEQFSCILAKGKSVAFVVRKGALTFDKKVTYQNEYSMNREEIIRHIIRYTGKDPVVSTTGKISRELFECREAAGQGHGYDFLTVGSMGHASSIALGIAMQNAERRIWCIDGDGAALMHMGSMAVLASSGVDNIVHIVINNAAHETVGGMPTVASKVNLPDIAKGCRYDHVGQVENFESLDRVLEKVQGLSGTVFLEIKAALGSRKDLGRPTSGPIENKEAFMEHLCGLS
jgi:phosphonopyruvate decarboxylase